MSITVTFHPSGRGKAQCAPDPDYPNGKVIDCAGNQLSCTVDLPYPAPECGHFLVKCAICSLQVAVTAAGRTDDPTKLILPCKFKSGGAA
jgi:hypothetical protein